MSVISNFPKYSELNSQTDSSYALAISWYKTREELFEKQLDKQIRLRCAEFKQAIRDTISTFSSEIFDKVKGSIWGAKNSGNFNKGSLVAGLQDQNEEFTALRLQLLDKASIAAPWFLKRESGKMMEDFIAAHFMPALSPDLVTEFGEAKANQMMENFSSQLISLGNKFRNTSSVTAKGHKVETRTDIAYGKLKDTDQIEFNTDIDLSQVNNLDALIAQVNDQIRVDSIEMSAFGFQVKTYTNMDNKRWMNSSVMEERINRIFHNGKTWSSNYASIYPIYYLSKYLINLIGPINVGIITGSDFIYVSDFLASHRLYMEVAAEKGSTGRRKNSTEKRGGGQEIYPKIAGDTILMKTGTSFSGSNGQTRQSHQYKSVFAKQKKDKITVFSIKNTSNLTK